MDWSEVLVNCRLFVLEVKKSMSGKVLVADDSGVMRKIIVRALQACGVNDVVEAADGAEGMQMFTEHQSEIGLVMTDWNMPNKNGLEFLQEIRATGSKVPVMMITTETEKTAVLQAIQAGVTDYLTKPFETEQLLTKIEKFALV
jgi:two-component system chemotaxis response regulator CheY